MGNINLAFYDGLWRFHDQLGVLTITDVLIGYSSLAVKDTNLISDFLSEASILF